jgi:hypothetical protein
VPFSSWSRDRAARSIAGNRDGLGGIHVVVGIFGKRQPSLATVHGRPLLCIICGTGEFWHREVKLNSTGLELFDLGWANRSALGLICTDCGFVHEFVGDAVTLWKREHGYPEDEHGYPEE